IFLSSPTFAFSSSLLQIPSFNFALAHPPSETQILNLPPSVSFLPKPANPISRLESSATGRRLHPRRRSSLDHFPPKLAVISESIAIEPSLCSRELCCYRKTCVSPADAVAQKISSCLVFIVVGVALVLCLLMVFGILWFRGCFGGRLSREQGDNLAILKADVKNQMKLVNSLKKKSLWSKTFEEVMPKLVDIVQLLHFKIHEAFESTDDDEPVECSLRNCERLGSTGTSLQNVGNTCLEYTCSWYMDSRLSLVYLCYRLQIIVTMRTAIIQDIQSLENDL
ncbi:hypothetical protein ABKV19_013667, partial [Rosa sericea]